MYNFGKTSVEASMISDTAAKRNLKKYIAKPEKAAAEKNWQIEKFD